MRIFQSRRRSVLPNKPIVHGPLKVSLVTLSVLNAITLGVIALGDSVQVVSTIGISFLLNLIVVSFVIAKLAERGRVTTGLVHLLGVWIMLCLAPLSAFLNGKFESYDFFRISFSDEIVVTANAFILIWVIFFCGSYLKRSRRAKSGGLATGISTYGIWLQLLVGFGSLAYIYDKVGFGVLTRKGFEEALTGDTTMAIVLFFGPVRMASIFALVAGTWYLFQMSGHNWKKGILSIVLLILAISTMAINNPIAAPRYFIGSVAIGVAFLVWFRNGGRATHFVLIMLAMTLVMFPIDAGRTSADVVEALSDLVFSVDAGLRQDNFRTYESIVAALYFTEKWGSVHGMQFVGNIFFVVPRSMWEGKAVGTGTFLAQSFGESFTNVACPLPCEAIVNFGFIGVPFVAVAFGWILRRLDEWYWQRKALALKGMKGQRILYPFLLGNIFFLTRGDLLSPLAYSVTMGLGALPLYLGGLVERGLKRGTAVART